MGVPKAHFLCAGPLSVSTRSSARTTSFKASPLQRIESPRMSEKMPLRSSIRARSVRNWRSVRTVDGNEDLSSKWRSRTARAAVASVCRPADKSAGPRSESTRSAPIGIPTLGASPRLSTDRARCGNASSLLVPGKLASRNLSQSATSSVESFSMRSRSSSNRSNGERGHSSFALLRTLGACPASYDLAGCRWVSPEPSRGPWTFWTLTKNSELIGPKWRSAPLW